MTVPFYGHVKQYHNIKSEIDRNIQEVLAEGDFRVAYFYYFRKADRAAVSRLAELAGRYPLYSQSDRSFWMLGAIYERNEHREIADQFYAKIVRDYPLSAFAADSKTKLVQSNLPLPQPDPTALARMQKEQQTPRPRANFAARSLDMLRTGPDVTMAAHNGTPTLTPPEDPNNETLTLGAISSSALKLALRTINSIAFQQTNAIYTTNFQKTISNSILGH